jgi:hypothetical protein
MNPISPRVRRAPILLVVAIFAGLAPASANELDTAIADPALAPVTGCEVFGQPRCLLPFPNDRFTVADETMATGRRIAIGALGTPRALRGVKPVFTDELNRNDGWSPGSMLLARIPGLDLHETWGVTTDHITDIARYTADDAPILVINADTGQRHAFWSELDTHPETTDADRLLILRPAVNFDEATRYIVVLRDLKDSNGATIPAPAAFAAYRDGIGSDATRQAEVARILTEASNAEGDGFDVADVHLAWEFTVASADNLAGRALHMRDTAFAMLGDTNLADGVVQGAAPTIVIDEVEAATRADTARIIHGRVMVPNFLAPHVATPHMANPPDGFPEDTVPPVFLPGSRMLFEPGTQTPMLNPVQPWYDAGFTCRIPTSSTAANPGRPTLMGHGLLGMRYEVNWSSGNTLAGSHNVLYCASEWIGMSFGDLPNVATHLADPSTFPSLADRAQQGFLNFLILGRAMIHPQGFAALAEFQDTDGAAIIGTNLAYDGNSQGGIMGGALAALAVDYTTASLGVPGMNYSTLLNRSVDWEGEGWELGDPEIPPYATFMYASIPDKIDQQIGFNLIQMLWDRGEANGFAHHMTDDPYPNTPAHRVMLNVAYGDYQVANVSAEVEARTIGARLLQTAVAPSRHWSIDPAFGLDVFDTDGGGALMPYAGSALVYWDSGNLAPPNGNIPPHVVGGDPHGDPRSAPRSGPQRIRFFDTGEVIDVWPGFNYCTRSTASPRAPGGYAGVSCPS